MAHSDRWAVFTHIIKTKMGEGAAFACECEILKDLNASLIANNTGNDYELSHNAELSSYLAVVKFSPDCSEPQISSMIMAAGRPKRIV